MAPTPISQLPMASGAPKNRPKGAELFRAQLKILIKKDFWIIRKHKKAMCVEILFPILLAVGIAMIISQSSGMSSPINVDQPVQPPSLSSFSPIFAAPQGVFPVLSGSPSWGGPSPVLFNDTEEESLALYSKLRQQQSYLSTTTVYGFYGTKNVSSYTSSDHITLMYFNADGRNMLNWANMIFSLFNPTAAQEEASQSYVNDEYTSSSGNGTYAPYLLGTTKVYVQQMNMNQMIATFAALMTSFAFFPMLSSMGGRLTDEKRCKLREHLRVMGVKPLAYVFATYGSGTLRALFVVVSLIVAMSATGGVTGIAILGFFLLLLCYGWSLIAFALFMPVFFSRSSFSTGACSLFLAVGTVGGIMSTALPASAQWVFAVIFSPCAYVMAASQILGGYTTTLPVPWYIAVLLLVAQVIWYIALSQYMTALFPGEYGVPQSALFPCYQLHRFFAGPEEKSNIRSVSMLEQGEGNEAIILKNLVKCYGSQRDTKAVDGLNLGIHKGEIFVLLGHNGAGKTTTISMLTGMLDATSYDAAFVDGLDLSKDIDLIRNRIGTCPQFDILYDDLSGQQHMELYAKVKGVPPLWGQELLLALGLPETDQNSSTYSGGMKRRLSVACSLVGGSDIIFLDEPSSGLDPVSRRQLWDLLRALRSHGKTIILTTHFMEEADYLGDRIAIMSHGRLYCCDTSSSLKHQYGVGYYLTVAKANTHGQSSPNHRGENSSNVNGAFDSDALLNIIRSYCPQAKLHHESMGEAQYVLPMESIDCFGKMLLYVEEHMASLGITSYGMRMNSLEDVFVSISQKESSQHGGDPLDMSHYDTVHLKDGRAAEELFAASVHHNVITLFFSQVLTVMYKKALYLKRSKRMWFLGIFIPLVLVAIGFATVFELPSNSEAQWMQSGSSRPDFSDWAVPVAGPLSPRQSRMLQIASEFYPSYVGVIAPEMAVSDRPDAQLRFPLYTMQQFTTGSWLDTHSIAWTSMIDSEHPVMLMFHNIYGNNEYIEVPTSKSNPSMPLYEGLDVAMGAPRVYDPSCAFFMHQLLNFAKVKLLLEENATMFPEPVFPNYTSMPFPPVYNASEEESSSSDGDGIQGIYMLYGLPVFLMLAVGQYASNAALEVADELNKRTFHTLRMHGLTAHAYWIGTLFFDCFVALIMPIGLIAGTYIRKLDFFQNEFIALFCFQTMGFVAHILLVAYALVAILPIMKPSTYISVIQGVTIAELVIPVIAWAGGSSSGMSTAHMETMTKILAFPPRAIQLACMSASPVDYYKSSEGAIALASSWYWSLIPVLILLWYTTKSTRGRDSQAALVINQRLAALHSQQNATQPQKQETSSTPLLGVPVTGATNLYAEDYQAFGLPILNTTTDPDVVQEESRVLSDPSANSAATIHLRQTYGGKKIAVHNMTFGVRKGECFGLLGPNGAGKTTTVKMLLQELAPSSGVALYPYTNVSLDNAFLDTVYRNLRLGVCQQHDTLWDTFTDRQHMELFLKIRLGTAYSSKNWSDYIDAAISKVYLESEGKPVEAFSGGMKRKLSVAIAMYTGAVTMFLDEPSTGMDPYARRAMWKSINEALCNDRCVLLTTHSMEEADAVCSRIAIVTDGQMKCIGSGQHLKSRFGHGYTIGVILAAVPDEQADALVNQIDLHMKETFGSTCERQERIGLTLRYSVKQLSVGKAFDELASKKAEWKLESYSVDQVTSLEQIFIQFAGTEVLQTE